jgi:hypothetical protein
MKSSAPFAIWNEAVDMTGFGQKAAASDGTHALKKLRAAYGGKFDAAFRLRMATARAETLEQLLEDWCNERTRLGTP